MSTTNKLPQTGFVRIRGVLAPTGPLPISRSTWWAGVRAGRYPQPIKIGPRITAWSVESIRELIERLASPAEPAPESATALSSENNRARLTDARSGDQGEHE
jgi:predicted DNA-binding transcriptional regulator AlpA